MFLPTLCLETPGDMPHAAGRATPGLALVQRLARQRMSRSLWNFVAAVPA